MNSGAESKIAVVGLGALFPDAKNPDEFWQNILAKKVSIRALPADMFEEDVYFRPDLLTARNKEDKSVTNIAAWIKDLTFDTTRKYKIPPSVAEHMDSNQHAALFTTDQALNSNVLKNVSKDRVGVVFGNGMVGINYGHALARVQFQLIEHHFRSNPFVQKQLSRRDQDEILQYLRDTTLKDTLPITEDSAPGILPNIIAARIANVYDFHGPSFTVDAACASALAAIITGIQGLYLNEFDAVVCGSADMPLKQLGFIYFSALNALSPDGSFPFDKRANGFVMGQGSGTVVLKRLPDAIQNQDQIYAVITGYGEASDGKGKYIAAPNEDWQAVTIEKACRMAGYPVDTIELIEAHGTATIVGDVVEVAALKKAFAKLGSTKKNYCGLTSVKSNIGHLKSAAGIAGFIKAVLALHHKKLPPTASFREINPKLEIENSPFYIVDDVREWPSKQEHPRRANVSAFGFGGADYHVALQEYREQDYRQSMGVGFAAKPETTSSPIHQNDSVPNYGDQVVAFSGDTLAAVASQVQQFISRAERFDSFSQATVLHNPLISPKRHCRLAFLAASFSDLDSKYRFFESNRERLDAELLKAKGIFFKEGPATSPEQTAVMFPGQASQYPNMLQNIYRQHDSFRKWFQKADAYWFAKYGFTVTSLIFPNAGDTDTTLDKMRQTHHAHPVIFVASFALYHLLQDLGFRTQYLIGHSLGEITALAAAEKLSYEDALFLIEQRGYAFRNENLDDPGKMISIMGQMGLAQELINESGMALSLANVNSPQQTIIAGKSNDIEAFKLFLDQKMINNKILFVSHAFHSPIIASVAQRFYDQIKEMTFRKSPIEVMMNHTGEYYPNSAKSLHKIPELLRDQILEPVNFVRSIEKLHQSGVNLFVEVGPSSILSGLAKDILKDKPVTVLASNYKNADDVSTLQRLIAALFVEGLAVEIPLAQTPVRHAEASLNIPEHVTAREINTASLPQTSMKKERIVYGGVAIGLPGSYKPVFQDDNFEQIFAGRNFIEHLTDAEKQRLVDLQIRKLIKDEKGPSFKILESLEDVIQLAGKIGKIDMIRDYHIDEKDVVNLTSCIAMGVAAGYEALKDAQIPLVREYIKTSSGSLLPHKMALPKYMQEETGVIFANGFPMIDPVIEEVSRYISYKYGHKTRRELMRFYESLIERVKDHDTRKLLTDWYTLFYSRLTDNPGEEDVYQFNYHFMNQISAQANNRLATLINAKGPNFQMNAACSSTSNAISIAEDFIRSGRVKRMIVVGADDPSSKTNLPLLGAGFLCTGAATSEGNLYHAAIPFDKRRNGMIMSAGAVGIVLETREEVEKRGVVEVCELLGTLAFNTAKHPSQIDMEHFSVGLEKFIAQMEVEHGLKRKDLASQLLYISHETYTPPRGGCSQTEAEALRRTFGEDFRNIIVGNTKGMTGHTMGASIEDAVAAKALQFGLVPPVVNYSVPDPMLEGLNISRGGKHDCTYALKMSAGFGSQGHFALLKRSATGKNRVVDQIRYTEWLKDVSGDSNPQTEFWGRIFVVADQDVSQKSKKLAAPQQAASQSMAISPTSESETPARRTPSVEQVIHALSRMTGYPEEMLEREMELAADLGISRDKQAAILRDLAMEFSVSLPNVQLPERATIAMVLDWMTDKVTGSQIAPVESAHKPDVAGAITKESIQVETLKVFSEVTKYPEDMLDLEMEMEADLGIDTVKQATILSILGEKYRISQQEGMQLSNYPTIGHIVDLLYDQTMLGKQEEPIPLPQAPKAVLVQGSDKQSIVEDTLKVFSDITKYPVDMLDLNMEMEADLGIDTVKQATILSILGEKYRLQQEEGMQLSNYPTIGHIVDLLYEKGMGTHIEPAEAVQIETTSDSQGQQDQTIDSTSTLARQVVVLAEETIGVQDFEIKNKHLWILADEAEIAERVAAEMQKRHAKTSVFLFPPHRDDVEFEKAIESFAQSEPANVIVDCSHIGQDLDWTNLSAEQTQNLLWRSGLARFVFYKQLFNRSPRPIKVLLVTSIDGAFGLEASRLSVSDPTFGALTGFYKALRKEWAESQIKILDFAPRHLAADFKDSLEKMVAEIEHNGIGVEICYPDGSRKVTKMLDQEIKTTERLTFSENDTFLITGGGTGVGAQVFLSLAERYPAKLVVVDIIALPQDIERLAELDEAGMERHKREIQERLKTEHIKVTPAMVNHQFDAVTKAIEVFRNLDKVKKLGRQVEYCVCDVRDLHRLRDLVDNAKQKFGAITAIIHAAGLEKSHLIAQKSVAEFTDVFDVKALGAYHLAEICKTEPLKLVVAFSSISGRFGNSAQTDYSAANSFLSYWIKMLRTRNPEIYALSLAWSGWKDVGMAWRNEFVQKKSEELGLHWIEVSEGLNALFREIEHHTEDMEIVLHKGLNGFAEKGLFVNDLCDFPLLDRVESQNGVIQKAFRIFSVKRDALIDQHRLGKVPILPAVAYSELAVEYFALQAGKSPAYSLHNITFANAFKLFREQPRELFVEGQPLPDGNSWKIEIKSNFNPQNLAIPQTVLHSSATVTRGLSDYSDLNPENWTYHQDQPTSLPAEESLLLIQNSGIEQRIILGPLYNDVLRDSASKEPVLIYPLGTTYPTYFPMEQLSNPKYPLKTLLTNPCFLDSLYQACAAHLLVNKKRVYLPWEVEELGIVDIPQSPGLYRSYAQVVEETEDVVSFDVIMLDGDRRIRYFAKNARFRKINL